METKTCRECDETKPIDQFYRNRRSVDGYLHRCKVCQNKAVQRYRQTPQGKVTQNLSNAVNRGTNEIKAYKAIKGLMRKHTEDVLAQLGLKLP